MAEQQQAAKGSISSTTPGTLFLLGAHHPSWLEQVDVPLFVSHRRLRGQQRLPRALGPWALDSGGFTELAKYGGWRTSEGEYLEAVARYAEEIGHLQWAAPMDWMCEPFMLARTGRSVADHQATTVENYLALRQAAPSLPFVPVLQGWTLADYLACVDRYAANGVNLVAAPLVGLGSVCRRQATSEIGQIVTTLAELGLRLHGFGVKRAGLARYAAGLVGADSMAWSAEARRRAPLPGCRGHRNCANCLRYALRYRAQVLADLGQLVPPQQIERSRLLDAAPVAAAHADAQAAIYAALRRLGTVTGTDPLAGLTQVHALDRALATITAQRVAQARQQGVSWRDIGAALGMSKQAAQQRFAPLIAGLEASPSPDSYEPGS